MNLIHSIREIRFNCFVVVDTETGQDISSELTYDKAVDLVFKFENGLRWNAGLPLLTVEDLPALRSELAGDDAEKAQEAVAAHIWNTCETGCTPGGRKCGVYNQLWEAAHRLANNWTRAPFATINRWGTRRGHMSMAVALADVWMNGGEVITAPAGAAEAEEARRVEEKKAADERLAARRASGVRTRRPGRRY